MHDLTMKQIDVLKQTRVHRNRQERVGWLDVAAYFTQEPNPCICGMLSAKRPMFIDPKLPSEHQRELPTEHELNSTTTKHPNIY
mmetsp:Transcript_17508/g.26788  ORF Transcript_17508/g.26788 Transcript_17508/m.26788 type:complete len:84 (-) Transcript_17508:333-584(-)